MKEIMPRFLVLPFSMGCLSQTTTGEFDSSQSKKLKPESNQVATSMILEEESSSMVKIKKSWSFVALRRSNISRVMGRLIRVTCKSFTRIFAYKDIEDIEIEIEKEMEIGFPTDVKHVTHIGYDGSMTTNPVKNWDHIQPPETLSFPSVSLKQFELAMADQAETPTGFCTSKCS